MNSALKEALGLLQGTKMYKNVDKWSNRFGFDLPDKPKMISPLPENDTIDTVGKRFYVGQNMAREQAAKLPSPPQQPMKLQYPEWMSNATPSGALKLNATQQQILDNIRLGFNKVGNPPIATKSAQLAQLGYEVQQRGGDAYLPAALTLKETGGLRYGPAQLINNPVGIGPGIKYPNLDVALLGGGNAGLNGGPQKGLRGVLFGGIYDDYFKSGNLLDFFKRYTPDNVHNNPSYDNQIALMENLLAYFKP